jgi:hypothetical protein
MAKHRPQAIEYQMIKTNKWFFSKKPFFKLTKKLQYQC